MTLRQFGKAVLLFGVVGGGILSAVVGTLGWHASSPPGLIAIVLFGIANVGVFFLFAGSDLQVGGAAESASAGYVSQDTSHVMLDTPVGHTEIGLVLTGPALYAGLLWAFLAFGG